MTLERKGGSRQEKVSRYKAFGCFDAEVLSGRYRRYLDAVLSGNPSMFAVQISDEAKEMIRRALATEEGPYPGIMIHRQGLDC